MRTDPDLKLIIMGDLNDDPMDLSLAVLGAKKHVEDMTEDERDQHERDNLEDEYYKTQNEMDSPTGEDD